MKIYKGLVSQATLNQCFDEARKEGAEYIGVRTRIYDRVQVVIIRPKEFDLRQEYYNNAYDFHLRIKEAPNLMKVEAMAWSHTFSGMSRLMEE